MFSYSPLIPWDTQGCPVVFIRDEIQIKRVESYTKMNYCSLVTKFLILAISHV